MRKFFIYLLFSVLSFAAIAQDVPVTTTAATEQVQTERKQNMKFMAIGALIVSAYFLFLLITKQKANFWVVEFMAVVALLFAFMFIYLLLQPYLNENQLSSSWLMILIVLGVALITVPVHHYLMDWALDKLAHPEKNK